MKNSQKAIANMLKTNGVLFQEQVYSPLISNNQKIGAYYLDFLIENKLVLEIKKGDRFSKRNIEQVLSYLKIKNLKLGILANFGLSELRFRRIINFNS